MTGARITVRLDDKAFLAGMARLRTAAVEIGKPIGMALVEVVRERFQDARDPFGQPWAPLSPAYAAIKKGPGILRESQMLMRSITFEASADQVMVGSNRVYAAVHQFGATIVPKTAKALVFRLGDGVVRAKSVTIPQRPYLGFGPEDQKAVLEVVEIMVEQALGT